MRFTLRKPCRECPFRQGQTYLHPERAREIAEAVIAENLTFACHKTLEQPRVDRQMCAGAMALVRKLDAPNQMLQIAERFGLRDPERLLPEADALVYPSIDAMVAAHASGC